MLMTRIRKTGLVDNTVNDKNARINLLIEQPNEASASPCTSLFFFYLNL